MRPERADSYSASDQMRDDFELPRSTKTSELAAHRLAKMIVDEKMEPGTALPTEKEMAERLGIGRGSMREALRIVETFGLLEIRTGRHGGPVVRMPDAGDLSVALTLGFFVKGISMDDVLDARIAFEPFLAELAAQRITPSELLGLRATVEAMRRERASERVYLTAARDFHDLVAEVAGQPVLSHLSAGLHRIAGGEGVGISYAEPSRLSTVSAHEEIIEALEARDGERAKQLWETHLISARKYWKKRFPENAQRPVEWTLGAG